jgi:hydrogenase maturation protein HypF
VCGPQLFLWDEQGQAIAENFLALELASEAIKQGQIIALKGLGGFQLLVKASDQAGVNLLRQRKRRSEKPFAVMFPNIELVKKCCLVSTSEENLLLSPASPIVLLKLLLPNNSDQLIAQNINPGNPYLGVMLPYTPLHHLLMQELNFPVVATSGNISDEPICIDELEAFTKLKGIADLFLVHNRAIARPVDDSIVRIIADQPMILRRARGYAPLPIKINQIHQVSNNLPHILAVGGHLKNTIAISKNQQVLISQHIGDLSNSAAFQVFQDVINNLENLYDFVPDIVACDAHPDYISSKFTDQLNLPVVRVQHHYAHILACMAENNINPPVLGVAWDGTGYGLDQTIWGGEFIYITEKSWQRVAHFRPFPLLGGESSIKQPAKIALGLLYTIFGAEIFQENFAKKALLPINNFSVSELKIFAQMLEKNLNTPQTSSVGRLFDAIAGLTNLYSQVSFEGQAAMGLEFAINHHNYHDDAENGYPLSIENIDQLELNNPHSLPLIIDWQPMILAILADLPEIPMAIIAQKFHHTLINSIINIVQIINQKIPTEKIVLSGGCFQNKYLLENSLKKLQDNHFIPYWHKKIPPNDGGIALGQIMAVLRAISPE